MFAWPDCSVDVLPMTGADGSPYMRATSQQDDWQLLSIRSLPLYKSSSPIGVGSSGTRQWPSSSFPAGATELRQATAQLQSEHTVPNVQRA